MATSADTACPIPTGRIAAYCFVALLGVAVWAYFFLAPPTRRAAPIAPAADTPPETSTRAVPETPEWLTVSIETNPSPSPNGRVLTVGDRFRFRLRPAAGVIVYLFVGSAEGGETPVQADSWLTMGEKAGTQTLTVIASRAPVPSLAGLPEGAPMRDVKSLLGELHPTEARSEITADGVHLRAESTLDTGIIVGKIVLNH